MQKTQGLELIGNSCFAIYNYKFTL